MHALTFIFWNTGIYSYTRYITPQAAASGPGHHMGRFGLACLWVLIHSVWIWIMIEHNTSSASHVIIHLIRDPSNITCLNHSTYKSVWSISYSSPSIYAIFIIPNVGSVFYSIAIVVRPHLILQVGRVWLIYWYNSYIGVVLFYGLYHMIEPDIT